MLQARSLQRSKRQSLHSLRKQEARLGFLFALPVITGFFLFVFLPMVVSLVISLTDYTVFNQASFIGPQNYANKLSNADGLFWKSLGVTGYYVALAVPAQIVTAFVIALLLNSPIKGRSVFRTIFYLPTIVPVVATSIIWMWLFDPYSGLLNMGLGALGLPTSMWIFSEKSVIPSMVLMSLWSVGGTTVIFLAGLQDIPRQLYEAVDVDGGSALSKLRHITLPMMSPTIFFNVVMGIINGLQVFAQIYVMTEGGPNNASLMYGYYLYREAFTHSELGSASALGWILFVIILALTLLIFRTSALWVYYEGEVRP